jgi:hypothetical protein
MLLQLECFNFCQLNGNCETFNARNKINKSAKAIKSLTIANLFLTVHPHYYHYQQQQQRIQIH